jgi:hypothetical protein
VVIGQKKKIFAVAESWNKSNEVKLTEILPAEYKPTGIISMAEQQTHLSSEEHIKLRNALIDFSELFQGNVVTSVTWSAS